MSPRAPDRAKGPAGRSRGALLRQHRRQGGAGAWGSGAGGLRRFVGLYPWSAPRRTGGARLVWTNGSQGLHVNVVACYGTWGCSCIVLEGRRLRNLLTRPCTFWPLCFAGRPRASPEPTVLWGDRAAVPCRPVTTLEPRVVCAGPPLAGTDTGTNEARGRRSRAGRVRRRPNSDTDPYDLRSGLCDLRSGPGTAPATSSRGRSRACPARRCSG